MEILTQVSGMPRRSVLAKTGFSLQPFIAGHPFFLPPAYYFPGLMPPEDTMGMKLQEALTR
jgi:hypothetical protein